MKWLASWIALAVGANLSGCILNSVHLIHRPQDIEPGKAIVVIGLGAPLVELPPQIFLRFDEYSLKKHKMTGNCFFYNRIEATIPAPHAGIAYLVFEVPAGVYVLRSMRSTSPQWLAFVAPSGKAVYFGDFVTVDNQALELQYSLPAAQAHTSKIIPRAMLTQAEVLPDINPGPMLLCTP